MAEFHVHIDATRLDDSFERRLRETLAVRGESPSAFDERNCLPESVDFSCYFSTFSSQLRGGTRIVTKVLTRDNPGQPGMTPGCDLARAQRLTGRATELGRAEARFRRPWEGCPGRLSRAPHPDHGNRPARRSPAYRRHLAPDVSRLLGAAPATVEIARHSQKKLGAAPERSRSASIGRTGWRWGQSRANPSRRDSRPVCRGRTTVECGWITTMSHNIPTSRRLDRTEGRQARPGNERPSRSVGRTVAGITRDRWDADSAGVPRWGRRVPVSRCDRESRIPGSSRLIPD